MVSVEDSNEIPFVDPPKPWKKSVKVQCIEGTRWWVERGTLAHFRHWMGEVQLAHPGNLIPLQWVADFVGVSRAAVHKRAKSGGLTVFSFIVTTWSKNILGKVKDRDTRQRYDYAVISECEAWAQVLLSRADSDK